MPVTLGGPYTWAGQRYAERGVRGMLYRASAVDANQGLSTLKDVMISGNEGADPSGIHVSTPIWSRLGPFSMMQLRW